MINYNDASLADEGTSSGGAMKEKSWAHSYTTSIKQVWTKFNLSIISWKKAHIFKLEKVQCIK